MCCKVSIKLPLNRGIIILFLLLYSLLLSAQTSQRTNINENNSSKKGIIYYDNGSICYEGGFFRDKAHGSGNLYYQSNTNTYGELIYEGKWHNGVPHGKGKLYYKNRIIVYGGEWKYGIPVDKKSSDNERAYGNSIGQDTIFNDTGEIFFKGVLVKGFYDSKGDYYLNGFILNKNIETLNASDILLKRIIIQKLHRSGTDYYLSESPTYQNNLTRKSNRPSLKAALIKELSLSKKQYRLDDKLHFSGHIYHYNNHRFKLSRVEGDLYNERTETTKRVSKFEYTSDILNRFAMLEYGLKVDNESNIISHLALTINGFKSKWNRIGLKVFTNNRDLDLTKNLYVHSSIIGGSVSGQFYKTLDNSITLSIREAGIGVNMLVPAGKVTAVIFGIGKTWLVSSNLSFDSTKIQNSSLRIKNQNIENSLDQDNSLISNLYIEFGFQWRSLRISSTFRFFNTFHPNSSYPLYEMKDQGNFALSQPKTRDVGTEIGISVNLRIIKKEEWKKSKSFVRRIFKKRKK